MDANERELILKEEVYAVVACAIEVLNEGMGLYEKIYEKCASFPPISVHSRSFAVSFRPEII